MRNTQTRNSTPPFPQSRGHLVADIDPLGILNADIQRDPDNNLRANEKVTRTYMNFGNCQHFFNIICNFVVQQLRFGQKSWGFFETGLNLD